MSGMLSSVLIRKMTPTLLPQDLKIYMNVYCIMMLMLCQLLAAKRGQQSVFFQYIKAHLTPMVHLKISCIWDGLHHYLRGQTDLSQPMKISGKWNWWIHEVFYPRVYFISIPFFVCSWLTISWPARKFQWLHHQLICPSFIIDGSFLPRPNGHWEQRIWTFQIISNISSPNPIRLHWKPL